MKNKNYFVLTAMLLIGVVLLSGCSGGSSDGVNNLEAEAVIQSAFKELESQNINEAEKYFADNFELQSYNDKTSLKEFLSFFEDEVYEDENMKEVYSVSNIDINDLNLISSSATEKKFKATFAIEITETYTYFEDNTEEKEVFVNKEEMIITINNNNKISSIKEIYPEEEIKMLEALVQTIENKNKTEFESYFAEDPYIVDYSDYDNAPIEFNNPEELYNLIIENYQTDIIDFYYYYFETIDANNVLINFEIELNDNNNNWIAIDIDSKIEYNNGDLKITSLEIYNIWKIE